MMEPTFQIGDLADKTGISVRTLRHYDEVGLLKPSEYSEAGYRLYEETDLVRLQQITSLKSMGLELEQIAAILQKGSMSPEKILQAQITTLREQMLLREEAAEKLDGLLRFWKAHQTVTAETLLSAIATMTKMEETFTDEQRAELKERAKAFGREGLVQAENDWATLIAAVKAEMEKGTDPKDPEVQALAKKWKALAEAFTGGNPEIAGRLKKMYEREGEKAVQWGGPDPAMMAYIGKAMQ